MSSTFEFWLELAWLGTKFKSQSLKSSILFSILHCHNPDLTGCKQDPLDFTVRTVYICNQDRNRYHKVKTVKTTTTLVIYIFILYVIVLTPSFLFIVIPFVCNHHRSVRSDLLMMLQANAIAYIKCNILQFFSKAKSSYARSVCFETLLYPPFHFFQHCNDF